MALENEKRTNKPKSLTSLSKIYGVPGTIRTCGTRIRKGHAWGQVLNFELAVFANSKFKTCSPKS